MDFKELDVLIKKYDKIIVGIILSYGITVFFCMYTLFLILPNQLPVDEKNFILLWIDQNVTATMGTSIDSTGNFPFLDKIENFYEIYIFPFIVSILSFIIFLLYNFRMNIIRKCIEKNPSRRIEIVREYRLSIFYFQDEVYKKILAIIIFLLILYIGLYLDQSYMSICRGMRSCKKYKFLFCFIISLKDMVSITVIFFLLQLIFNIFRKDEMRYV